jgi:hypothetical protein
VVSSRTGPEPLRTLTRTVDPRSAVLRSTTTVLLVTKSLPSPQRRPAGCACIRLPCAGWESIGEPLGEPLLRRLGTLRDPARVV